MLYIRYPLSLPCGGSAVQAKTRDKAAALDFMKKAMKWYGKPEVVVTDGLRFYAAAMAELGNAQKREVARWANNRVENSHLPSDDGSERCSGSDKSRRCRNSARCTPRSTITSTRNVISSIVRLQSWPHWPSGG
ncbi:MAG: DDE-type integrase/transposase/recombinase [Sphingomicrobium sp.]